MTDPTDSTTRGRLSPRETLALHAILAGVLLATGVALLIYMVTVEGEPGALPLALVVLGAGWSWVTRSRRRAVPRD